MTLHVSEVLAARRGTLHLNHRIAQLDGRIVQLDHLYSATAGAFLLQERDLAGELCFVDGTLRRRLPGTTAEQDDRALLDQIRRTAEQLEYEISRPVEPVLVVTTGTPFVTTTVRAVHVVHASALTEFLDGLPDTVDRPEMVLLNARLSKLTRACVRDRRIPEWEVRGVIRTFNGQADPGAPKQGPRDFRQLYSAPPSAPAVPRRHSSGEARRARGESRAHNTAVVALIVIAAVLLAILLRF